MGGDDAESRDVGLTNERRREDYTSSGPTVVVVRENFTNLWDVCLLWRRINFEIEGQKFIDFGAVGTIFLEII